MRVLATLESNFINEKYEEIYNDRVKAPNLNKKPQHSDTITTSKSKVQSQSTDPHVLESSTIHPTQNSGSTESINLLAEEERVEVNVGKGLRTVCLTKVLT